jgi:hypothetical protein
MKTQEQWGRFFFDFVFDRYGEETPSGDERAAAWERCKADGFARFMEAHPLPLFLDKNKIPETVRPWYDEISKWFLAQAIDEVLTDPNE